jgi:hypothetical protein
MLTLLISYPEYENVSWAAFIRVSREARVVELSAIKVGKNVMNSYGLIVNPEIHR